MPKFGKKSLSLFLRNKCERQFINSIYNNQELKDKGLPPRQDSRFALGIVGREGYKWQNKKVEELVNAFGEENFRFNRPRKNIYQPPKVDLLRALKEDEKPLFIIEAEYQSGNEVSKKAIGLDELEDTFGEKVDVKNSQIDVLQILAPLSQENEEEKLETADNPYRKGVNPDGTVFPLSNDDKRYRLRVIDIKQNSDPGHNYFAEVVYYSMTLAGWLKFNNLDDEYVVIAATAIWAGGYDDNNLIEIVAEYTKRMLDTPFAEARDALNNSLKLAVFEVYAPRLRRFLSEELPQLLKKSWDELDWHVDQRCKGCELIGYRWTEDENVPDSLCLPDAEAKKHLSRIYGLSGGGRKFLNKSKVDDIEALAKRNPSDAVFNNHQILRSKRSVFPQRAEVLQNGKASIISYSGSDALMPKYADLRIYIFLDYDLSTAVTSVLGLQANWTEPLPYQSELRERQEAKKKRWTYNVNEKTGVAEDERLFLIESPKIEREKEEFIKFLKKIKEILSDVAKTDEEDAKEGRRTKDGKINDRDRFSSYQIYLWDKGQYKHLVRLIERHLIYILNDEELRDLAWLFPPPQLLQSPDNATRKSPFTFVADVVKNTIAVPVPHYYSLLDVAKHWKSDAVEIKDINSLYQEPMSDLIPAERIHSWWNRVGQWHKTQRGIEFTCQQKLKALEAIVIKLENELSQRLSSYSAPNIVSNIRRGKLIAPLCQLWLEYMRLDDSLSNLENHQLLSMPVHEKEAKFKAARLTYRARGKEEIEALKGLSTAIGRDLLKSDNLFVYKLKKGSENINIKPGDINFALSPEKSEKARNSFPRFLDTHINKILEGGYLAGTILEKWSESKRLKYQRGESGTIDELGITEVSIESVDRDSGYIALRPGNYNRIQDLERHPDIDFSKNVVLDKVHRNYLLNKLEPTLKGIGYYRSEDDDKIFGVLYSPVAAQKKLNSDVPATKIFWKTGELSENTTGFDALDAKNELIKHLENTGGDLDSSQWKAWERALSHQFSLIWGPPGTGKSWTLRAVITGAILEARRTGRPLRLLITAGTNTAVENILYKLEEDLTRGGLISLCKMYQTISKSKIIPNEIKSKHPNLKILPVNPYDPLNKIEVNELLSTLNEPKEITIVGSTPQQLHNLAVFGISKEKQKDFHTIRSWFDLIVLDEASQIDIATTSLIYSKITDEGSTVLAGDNLQLPPIQKASPPEELEYLVGSAYDFFRFHRKIEPVSLDINYRSNETIVNLTKEAGYSAKLESYSPNLKLNLLNSVPKLKPPGWNEKLYWSENWSKFLNSENSVMCFVYEDDESSQINDFEADSIASLIWLLRERMLNQLLNDNTIKNLSTPVKLYTMKEFWSKAIGVVTPHRAQMSKIINKLQNTFPGHSAQAIRDAVDTVERFQGQQRDVIICSFGVGDADIIGSEDEFLYNLKRFNVISSRSRTKFIVFLTRTLLDHLSDDQDVLAESRLIKKFAEQFCNKSEPLELGFINQGENIKRSGILRWNQQ